MGLRIEHDDSSRRVIDEHDEVRLEQYLCYNCDEWFDRDGEDPPIRYTNPSSITRPGYLCGDCEEELTELELRHFEPDMED